ncbi:uncharacterized protein B0I36DRAFT_136085 [Microdochium trichocladiopsis]|uniref:Uncharacterized protein n=1 Tax=Microdochium trichocladiopsis TaxID=1682393 RepID=A0A9P9BNA5_9PEZI|nr:uncharacterized protein B0I36DRAFT_136085 [Microdochium trichocladiopsis]KAH7027189.1 hypothetical protein B0I36DRAFT_136085 [Microdochium trichocladiopsis]
MHHHLNNPPAKVSAIILVIVANNLACTFSVVIKPRSRDLWTLPAVLSPRM